MTSGLLKQVRRIASLEKAWNVIRTNGRASKSETVRRDIEAFADDAEKQLRSIQRRLIRGTFVFPPARGIPIPKASGGIRPIVLAPVESRIVQRAILDQLQALPALQRYFINPHSFGGIRRSQKGRRSSTLDPGTAAVPGAVAACINAISNGAQYAICADIAAFFTRISKSSVSTIIRQAVDDEAFMSLFEQAISVELANLADLRTHAHRFPTEDLGVAQGSSLSPLLGNILLHEFDRFMNEGDCRCIRYIDDFVILAPSIRAANARFKKASRHLQSLQMSLAREKTSEHPRSISEGFEFLGVEILSGLVRPAPRARAKFLHSIQAICRDGQAALVGHRNGVPMMKKQALLGTLKQLDGAIQGWGKHYRFCSDKLFFKNVDRKIATMVDTYISFYNSRAREIPTEHSMEVLGIERLETIELQGSWKKEKREDHTPETTASCSTTGSV